MVARSASNDAANKIAAGHQDFHPHDPAASVPGCSKRGKRSPNSPTTTGCRRRAPNSIRRSRLVLVCTLKLPPRSSPSAPAAASDQIASHQSIAGAGEAKEYFSSGDASRQAVEADLARDQFFTKDFTPTVPRTLPTRSRIGCVNRQLSGHSPSRPALAGLPENPPFFPAIVYSRNRWAGDPLHARYEIPHGRSCGRRGAAGSRYRTAGFCESSGKRAHIFQR